MGLLVDGHWQDQWYDTKSSGGKFKRQASQFRDAISDSPDARFAPESGRYHLYVSLACPWAHRTLIFRALKQLDAHIDVSVVSPDMLEHGWTFAEYPGTTGDRLYGCDYLHQIYTRAKPDITTRVTVPVLWDKHHQTIVSNESADIIRMFNSAFNGLTGNQDDYYPQAHRHAIDEINQFVYDNINNGVYKTGFATTQAAYEEAFEQLFAALDEVEHRLSGQRYLVADVLTEADWRLFTTLVRFDAVYVGHFKCNRRRIADYPEISDYLRHLYQYPGVSETVNMDHIKRHYYFSHTMINPTQIVPKGPALDLEQPSKRNQGG
ncbi:glutathione S-transferase family protein [Aestuariibacter halophilus]|uniref:Glutathione S-transferase family protein n=1 Tax=Fluctibacter halophilus TaxID=226011 RepID=A0ABS8G4F5_9ALTE|nr:glutathione S-transferase family protein [Aestuariibacter halophilus]MCC2615477.1 glutathione S-transferase family protein [Aestuariibacter halophilus]